MAQPTWPRAAQGMAPTRVLIGLASAFLVAVVAYWFGVGAGLWPEGIAIARAGLTEEESRLATVFMQGQWIESDLLIDDTEAWLGSGVIIDEDRGDLIILTNSHCLALPNIVSGQPETPDVLAYELTVRLAGSDKPRLVKQFAETRASGLDLALLRIDASDVRRGTDFEIAPISDRAKATQGMDTVAIGAPLGFRGTETFGRVSAVRSFSNSGGLQVLQTDAAINSGSSGGPLFVVSDGGRFLVAVNTFGISGAENLNFAYFADEYRSRKWEWFDATPEGVVKALREIYNFEAEVAR